LAVLEEIILIEIVASKCQQEKPKVGAAP